MKLPTVSGRKAVKAFGKLGYVVDRQRGSHVIMVKTDPNFKLISIPNHKVVSKGTLHRILSDAGVTIEEFVKALK